MNNPLVVSPSISSRPVVSSPFNSPQFHSLRSQSNFLIVTTAVFAMVGSHFVAAQQAGTIKSVPQGSTNISVGTAAGAPQQERNLQVSLTGGGVFGQYVRAMRELLRTHESELPQSLAVNLKNVEAHLENSKKDRQYQFSPEQITDLKNFYTQAANIQDEFKRIHRLDLRLTSLNQRVQFSSEKPDWFSDLSGALDREFKAVKLDWRSESPEFKAKVATLENKIKNFESVVSSNRELHEYVNWAQGFLERELGTTHRFTTSLQKEWDQMNSAVLGQIEILYRPQTYETFEAASASNSAELNDVISSAKGFTQKIEDPVFLHQKIREAGFESLGAQMPSLGGGLVVISVLTLLLMAGARFTQRQQVRLREQGDDTRRKA